MSLQAEDTNTLSRDTISSIRFFCFATFSGFYDRYKSQLPMDRSTFYRVVTGENVRKENTDAVEFLAKKLGLIEMGKAGSDFVSQKTCIKKLYKNLESVFREPSMKNLAKLKAYADKFKGVILR